MSFLLNSPFTKTKYVWTKISAELQGSAEPLRKWTWQKKKVPLQEEWMLSGNFAERFFTLILRKKKVDRKDILKEQNCVLIKDIKKKKRENRRW